MSTMKRLRRTWLRIHLWLGVGLALAILPLAASGAALVWRGELERLLEPQRFSAPREAVLLAPSAYLDAGRRALGPQIPVALLQYPEAKGDAVIVAGDTADGFMAVWLDPQTAAVRDIDDPRASLLGWLHVLHGNLFIPEVGRKVVGWLGWAMLVSAITGLWLWWPRGGTLLDALRWRRSPSIVLNLHHLVGFWLCIPLGLIALTGVYISFPKMIAAALPPPTMQEAKFKTEGIVDIDRAIAIARELVPGARVVRIILPSEPQGDWQVMLGGPASVKVESPLAGGLTTVRPWGDPLSRTVRAIHDGSGAWPLWRGVLSAAGLAPVILATTGVIIWARRQANRRRAANGR